MGCKHNKKIVIDTRQRDAYRYRRYKCNDCNYRISTVEIPVEVYGHGSHAGIIALQKKFNGLTEKETTALIGLLKAFEERIKPLKGSFKGIT